VASIDTVLGPHGAHDRPVQKGREPAPRKRKPHKTSAPRAALARKELLSHYLRLLLDASDSDPSGVGPYAYGAIFPQPTPIARRLVVRRAGPGKVSGLIGESVCHAEAETV
jgi:hypothetical protein